EMWPSLMMLRKKNKWPRGNEFPGFPSNSDQLMTHPPNARSRPFFPSLSRAIRGLCRKAHGIRRETQATRVLAVVHLHGGLQLLIIADTGLSLQLGPIRIPKSTILLRMLGVIDPLNP